MARRFVAVGRALGTIGLTALVSACTRGPITPATRDIYMSPDRGSDLAFDITPPPMAPRYAPIDIAFVVDGTGSMGSVIGAVQNSATGILADIAGRSRDVRYAVIEFGDYPQLEGEGEPDAGHPVWRLVHDFTSDTAAVEGAIGGVGVHWNGGDRKEAYLRALEEARSLGWRPGATRYVILLGDAPARSPDPGRDEELGTADDLTPRTVSASYRRDRIALIGIYASKTWIGGDPVATSFGELTGPTLHGMALPLRRDSDVRDAIRQGLVEVPPPPPAMVLATQDFRAWSGDPRRQTAVGVGPYRFRARLAPPPHTPSGVYHLRFDALSWPGQPGSVFGAADVTVRIGWRYYPLKPLILPPWLLGCALGFMLAMRLRRGIHRWGLLLGGRAVREAALTAGVAAAVGVIGLFAYRSLPPDLHSMLAPFERRAAAAGPGVERRPVAAASANEHGA